LEISTQVTAAKKLSKSFRCKQIQKSVLKLEPRTTYLSHTSEKAIQITKSTFEKAYFMMWRQEKNQKNSSSQQTTTISFVFQVLDFCCPCCASGQTEQEHCNMCLHIHFDNALLDRAEEAEKAQR
jgi:hypothetical protein